MVLKAHQTNSMKSWCQSAQQLTRFMNIRTESNLLFQFLRFVCSKKVEFFAHFIVWIVLKNHVRRLSLIAKNTCTVFLFNYFFFLWFVILFLSFYYFGCLSLFLLWHENIQRQETSRREKDFNHILDERWADLLEISKRGR